MGNPILTNLDAMRRFAALADLVHSEHETRPDWAAVRDFTRCAEPYLQEIRQEVIHLVTTHEARFGLGMDSEPFRVDLGMHRWLRDEYEPAYSDWLQWILETLERTDLVLSLLGVPDASPIPQAAAARVSAVDREVPVWRHDGGLMGFLDLVIWLGDGARIVVELKKVDEAVEKQRDYVEALRGEGILTDYVLLAKDFAEAEDVFGFRTRNWEAFCLAARKLMPSVVQGKGNVVSALMLAFVGAVEENILKLDGDGVRQILSQKHNDNNRAIDAYTLRYLR